MLRPAVCLGVGGGGREGWGDGAVMGLHLRVCRCQSWGMGMGDLGGEQQVPRGPREPGCLWLVLAAGSHNWQWVMGRGFLVGGTY